MLFIDLKSAKLLSKYYTEIFKMSQQNFAICKLIYPSLPQILFDISKYLTRRSFIIIFPILTYHIVA